MQPEPIEKTMTINTAVLIDAYERARHFVEGQQDMAPGFAPVVRMFEDKKSKPDAVVMVYGVYNAGKSTLINMLLGREAAETDDIPLTDKVSAYQWGNYSILDTPGVDAPIKHEDVTKEQMLTADVIIFVVDPVGTAEESKTLLVLLDLLKAGKQVFLVFNEKKEIDEEDYIKLKDQTRQRLQQLALDSGLANVLKDIPIVKVNARRALQGMLKSQPKFVELSGYPAFEKQLTTFLQGISSDDIYGRLKQQLVDVLQHHAAMRQELAQSDAGKKYDNLLRSISVEKANLAKSVQRELARQRLSIYEKSKVCMRTAPADCQSRIEQLLQQSAEQLCSSVNNDMSVLMATVQSEIAEVQATLPSINPKLDDVKLPQRAGEAISHDEQTVGGAGFDSTKIADAATQIATLAKAEHIVSGLKTVKELLPSLMKGIGIKTMEKWASVLLTKWVPYVGIIVSIGQTLHGLLAGDPEAAKLRKQNREEELARERAIEQMDDFASELADGFELSMRNSIFGEIELFFSNIAKQVELLRLAFDEADQENSLQLETLLAIREQALNA